jgi:hypothetical protein
LYLIGKFISQAYWTWLLRIVAWWPSVTNHCPLTPPEDLICSLTIQLAISSPASRMSLYQWVTRLLKTSLIANSPDCSLAVVDLGDRALSILIAIAAASAVIGAVRAAEFRVAQLAYRESPALMVESINHRWAPLAMEARLEWPALFVLIKRLAISALLCSSALISCAVSMSNAPADLVWAPPDVFIE